MCTAPLRSRALRHDLSRASRHNLRRGSKQSTHMYFVRTGHTPEMMSCSDTFPTRSAHSRTTSRTVSKMLVPQQACSAWRRQDLRERTFERTPVACFFRLDRSTVHDSVGASPTGSIKTRQGSSKTYYVAGAGAACRTFRTCWTLETVTITNPAANSAWNGMAAHSPRTIVTPRPIVQ